MNVVRMNTAHASREGFEKLINNVRTVSNRIGILMDTKVGSTYYGQCRRPD